MSARTQELACVMHAHARRLADATLANAGRRPALAPHNDPAIVSIVEDLKGLIERGRAESRSNAA